MKNFKNLLPLQNIQKFINKQYEKGFDYVTLALANTLNRNLRKIIQRKGKNPNTVIEPSLHKILPEIFDQVSKKRSPTSFHFIGSPSDYVTDKSKHPILKFRSDESSTIVKPLPEPLLEVILPLDTLVDIETPKKSERKKLVSKKSSKKANK